MYVGGSRIVHQLASTTSLLNILISVLQKQCHLSSRDSQLITWRSPIIHSAQTYHNKCNRIPLDFFEIVFCNFSSLQMNHTFLKLAQQNQVNHSLSLLLYFCAHFVSYCSSTLHLDIF